jgi:hypothetical protein
MIRSSTQLVTEMRARDLLGERGDRLARKARNLRAIYKPTVYTMWEHRCIFITKYYLDWQRIITNYELKIRALEAKQT